VKSDVYNKAFYTGATFSLVVVAALNVWSYYAEHAAYERKIKFSPFRGVDFGFPLFWSNDPFPMETILNVFAIFFLCLVSGFVFRMVHQKVFSRIR
jgi:hypothetical protein